LKENKDYRVNQSSVFTKSVDKREFEETFGMVKKKNDADMEDEDEYGGVIGSEGFS